MATWWMFDALFTFLPKRDACRGLAAHRFSPLLRPLVVESLYVGSMICGISLMTQDRFLGETGAGPCFVASPSQMPNFQNWRSDSSHGKGALLAEVHRN